MKSIALRPWELAAYMRWKNGGHKGPFLLVRPVKSRWDNRWEVDDCGPNGAMWPYWPDYVHGGEMDDPRMPCPFGKPGEVLGIKEPFEIAPERHEPDNHTWLTYLADVHREEIDGSEIDMGRLELGRKYGARSLPLWAVRHRPTIADIRVMTLKEITSAMSREAGCEGGHGTNGTMYSADPYEHFRYRWKKDHGEKSWAANPWCWFMNVVE